jgi:hypothetical protein
VEVQLAQGTAEAIRVLEVSGVLAVPHPQAVSEAMLPGWACRLPKATRVDALHRRCRTRLAGDQPRFVGVGQESANHEPGTVPSAVHPEDAERIGVFALDDPQGVGLRNDRSHAPGA